MGWLGRIWALQCYHRITGGKVLSTVIPQRYNVPILIGQTISHYKITERLGERAGREFFVLWAMWIRILFRCDCLLAGRALNRPVNRKTLQSPKGSKNSLRVTPRSEISAASSCGAGRQRDVCRCFWGTKSRVGRAELDGNGVVECEEIRGGYNLGLLQSVRLGESIDSETVTDLDCGPSGTRVKSSETRRSIGLRLGGTHA